MARSSRTDGWKWSTGGTATELHVGILMSDINIEIIKGNSMAIALEF